MWMSKSFSVELKRYADIRWTLFKKILSTCILSKDQQGVLTMVETKKFRKNVLSAMTSLTTQPHGFMVVGLHTGFKAYWIQFFKLWFKLEKKRMRFHGSPSLWLTSYNHTRVTQPKHISKSIQIEDSHHDLLGLFHGVATFYIQLWAKIAIALPLSYTVVLNHLSFGLKHNPDGLT